MKISLMDVVEMTRLVLLISGGLFVLHGGMGYLLFEEEVYFKWVFGGAALLFISVFTSTFLGDLRPRLITNYKNAYRLAGISSPLGSDVKTSSPRQPCNVEKESEGE